MEDGDGRIYRKKECALVTLFAPETRYHLNVPRYQGEDVVKSYFVDEFLGAQLDALMSSNTP